jgi:hypothetical protein
MQTTTSAVAAIFGENAYKKARKMHFSMLFYTFSLFSAKLGKSRKVHIQLGD